MKKLILASVLLGATATVSAGDTITTDSAAITQGIKEGTEVRMDGEVDHDDGRSVVDVKKVHSVKGTTTNSPSATISN